MNIKKMLLLTLPLLGIAAGGLVAFSKSAIVVEAADYSTSAKDFKLNTSDSSVSATFTVSNSNLEMKGWLLCLLTDKPEYDLDTRKLDYSDNLHPFGYTNCAHYFFATCTQRDGKMSITWAANAADQKDENLWNEEGSTSETENLAKYMTDANDYHIVIGPRHRETSWAKTDDIGGGKDFIWENCDYYVGRKNSLLYGVDGQTYLDLSKYTNWEDADAKFGFYYFDDTVTPKKEAWSEGFATISEHAHIYQAQYSLDFVPKKMIAVRFNNNADTLRWNAYDGENYVWNQSSDESFYEYGVSGVSYEYDAVQYWSYEMAGIKFSEDDIVTLDHLKRNTAGHSENFNQFVSLAEGDEFVVSFGSSTYTTYSTYDTLTSNFKLNGNNKIEVVEGGNYALYFDTDSHSLYITTELMAKLDEWCQLFLGADCKATKSNWNSSKYEYEVSIYRYEGAEEYLCSVPHAAHDAVVEGYIAKAMQRYDFLVEYFEGFTDYIGRCDSQHFSAYQSGALVISNSEVNTSMLVIIVAAVTLAAFTTLLVIKKRKSIR